MEAEPLRGLCTIRQNSPVQIDIWCLLATSMQAHKDRFGLPSRIIKKKSIPDLFLFFFLNFPMNPGRDYCVPTLSVCAHVRAQRDVA